MPLPMTRTSTSFLIIRSASASSLWSLAQDDAHSTAASPADPALAWGQELIDQLLFAGQWNLPMGPDQPWWGVITAPFSHAGFGHLISNSLAFLDEVLAHG